MASSSTNPDTLVTLKVNIEGTNKRFKLPLRELGASTLPDKLRYLLQIPPTSEVVFERFSDSAAAYVTLDPNNTAVYKQLYRAAKAKLKLRLKVTIKDQEEKEAVMPKPATVEDEVLDPAQEQAVYEPSAPAPEPEIPEPQFSHPAETAPRQTIPFPSFAELQLKLDDLHLNNVARMNQMHSQIHDIPIQSSSTSSAIPITQCASPGAREKWFADLAGLAKERQTTIRKSYRCPVSPATSTYTVYCNNCNEAVPDEHYHCSTCDDGDYDLCQSCIDKGVLCGGDGHWMIKRFVKNGKVINSVTETIAPRIHQTESKATLVQPEEPKMATRTCNCCIGEFPENNFVTCVSCEDYDVCLPCHHGLKHGHNPKHAFAPAIEDMELDPLANALLQPGRNTSHQAICDGCDSYIYGVRHKCLDCPDWDYCSACMPNAKFIHPRHRFVPLYEPINDATSALRAFARKPIHHGIYCDGPLCVNKSNNITGDRYKCAVCHDTDYCANCEASPSNQHNRTHPLIKFKTPIRNVSVTTMGDHDNGQRMPIMGDRHPNRFNSQSTETNTATSANAATQVQTVADLEPTEPVKLEEEKPVEAKTEYIKAEEVPEVVNEVEPEAPVAPLESELVAHFVSDAVQDGTVLAPNLVFEQTWILRNGGDKPWPAGCTVKFVGGDNMCAIDPEHPASVHELVSAAESTTCYTEVAPGQEYPFTVLMRTPNRAGKVISYWRLTGPNGYKFGHRLWCDVVVQEPTPVVKEEAKEEVKEEIKEEVQPEVKEVKEVEKSQMIFPKLDTESPIASVHEETVSTEIPIPAETDEFEDLVEEDHDLLEDDITEDGFLTDEEYDILDASDEEYLADQAKAAKK